MPPPITHQSLPAPPPPPSINPADPPRHGLRVRSLLSKKTLTSLFGDASTIQRKSKSRSSRASTSSSVSESSTPLSPSSVKEHYIRMSESPLPELPRRTGSHRRHSFSLSSDDEGFKESKPRFLPNHPTVRDVETRIASLSLEDQPTHNDSAVKDDIVVSSPQSMTSHSVNQLKEEGHSEIESSIAIQKDDSNYTAPSAPAEWKTVNEAYLKSVVKTKEGFKLLIGLEGDDAVIVVDIIDKILESHDITDNQRNIYTAILRKLCGKCGIFPTSHTLTGGLEKVGEWPKAGGGFAEVWEGRYKNRLVAIKAFRVYKDDILRIKKFCKEAVVWKRLSHPNILPFLGMATSPFPFCIVSPWMAYGNLKEYLTSHPQANRYLLLRDIVDGLGYLHSLSIVHGDMKGANILISDTCRACLADFGLTTIALDTLPGYSTTTMTSVGTARWMAPELLTPEKYGLEKSAPSREGDIYALGIVIYEVITGVVPFKEISDHKVTIKTLSGARPERPITTEPATLNFTNVVWPIAEECWREHRNERPTLSRVLERLSLPG